jgi:hypothetical protein
MPNLNIAIPHNLSQDDALKRIKGAIAQAKVEHSNSVKDLQENWNGNVGTFSGSAMGQTVSATITVNASEIVFDLALPFAASLIKRPIEAGIRDFTAKLLN